MGFPGRATCVHGLVGDGHPSVPCGVEQKSLHGLYLDSRGHAQRSAAVPHSATPRRSQGHGSR